jgi:hypothetical protein
MTNPAPLALREQAGAIAQTTSPMGLLQLAIEREGSIDVIERLAKLQMDMLDREARLAFVNAFEDFKRDAPTIVKDSAILVNGQERGKFAKLDQVCDKLIPALLKVGITHRWKTTEGEGGRIICTCYLRHRLGHEEQGATFGAPPDTSGSKNAVQAVGSTGSYLERYTLVASCGIAIKDQDKVDNPGGMDEKEFIRLRDNIEGANSIAEVTAAYIGSLKAAKTKDEKQAFEDAAKKRKGEIAK